MVSAIIYTADNNNKYADDARKHWSPHLTSWVRSMTTASCGTKTLNNKRTIVSLQSHSHSHCRLGSHTAQYVHENASSTHSILCSVLEAFISTGLILCESNASVEHLNASWMALDAFGRIIENQCISEQHSLAVRNIWAASFGLWNSIPQPHLNSNKQL